jgi:cell pole-organizing protein PopZ
MAGTLSSEEIEDVVSSVRRLVSNEQRPRSLTRDLKSDRLLLTAALRVMPETSPLALLVLDSPVVDTATVEVAMLTAEPTALAGDMPAAADPVEPQANAAEDVGLVVVPDEVEVVIDDDLLPTTDPERAADLAEASEEQPEAEWEDVILIDPATTPLGEAVDEAEILTGPAAQPEMADGTELDDGVEPWTPAGRDPDAGEPIPFVPLRRRAEHLATRLAAGEVVETPRPETAADIIPLTDVLPADAVGAIAADTGHAGASGRPVTEFVDADGVQIDVLDEHALQEFVRQTLRAELQGELGERITRNVRKLVRAEINRALMARDLD